jgi:hypothetical protein
MRRILTVLVVLVSSVLLVQAPAYSYHYYGRVHLTGKGNSGTFSVETNCPENGTLVLRSSTFRTGAVNITVPTGRKVEVPGEDFSRFSFTTEKLSSQARGLATLTGTCNGHALSFGKPYGEKKQTVSLDLPFTGRPVLPLVVLGLGLVLAGGVLIALGRTGGSSLGRS